MRDELQQRLAQAIVMTEEAGTMYCVQSFDTVLREGTERLGDLLARVMTDPKHSFVLTTEDAFVFAFENRMSRGKRHSVEDNQPLATEPV